MRSAWKVRVAGSIRCHPRAATARRTIAASWPVVAIGACRRASRWRAPPAAIAAPRRTGRSRRRARARRRVEPLRRRLARRAIHPHVERLVAAEAEAAAFLVELHRRHAEIGEQRPRRRHPAARRAPRRARGSRRARTSRDRRTRPARRAPSPARRDRDRCRSTASAPPSSSTRAWPPRPTVQSTNVPPRSGCSKRAHLVDQDREVRRASSN